MPTITEPVNDGVIILADGSGQIVPCRAKFWFIGLGSDNDAFSVRIIGWTRVDLDTMRPLWVPSLIAEYAVVVSAAVGVAGAAVLNTERFADTIAPVATHQGDLVIAAGTAINSEFQVLSPTGDVIGHVVMPLFGFEKLEFTFANTTGTPTKNVIYAFV